MKINTLLEYTSPSSQPNQAGGQAPEFGRDPNVLETTAGATGSGSVASVSDPVGKIQKRNGKGSMFQGIKTSKKFVNSPVTEDEISEEQLLARQLRKELFQQAKDKDIGNKPESRDIITKEADEEYDDEAGMVTTNLYTALRAVEGLNKVIGPNENLPEWVQEKIAIANDYLVTCWDYMISQHEQGRKYDVSENNQDWMTSMRAMAHKMAPQDKLRQSQIERQSQQQIEQQKRLQQDVENLPELMSQFREMKSEYESLGGRNWQYADSEQNLSDEERKARDMETSLRQLANRIRAAKKASEGLAEVAPPGAKAERMVKHIKKSYSKDGKLTPKEKSIAYATAWKAHNKGSVEEQGVAEAFGLYGPFTVTINTGERPQSRTKTKKFRREDDAILYAEDWLEDAPQYVFATAQVTDPNGNVVWTTDEQGVTEEWSQKYKSSINCSHPKGFSQKAHCAGKKKHNESVEMESVCPDCGMCETHSEHKNLDEACWKGYHKEGNKKMFGKTYPNCVKNEDIQEEKCPECSGPMFSELLINEKKDACYYKVKSRYKVWPSAYASGALVKCRKKGADSWGNKSKK